MKKNIGSFLYKSYSDEYKYLCDPYKLKNHVSRTQKTNQALICNPGQNIWKKIEKSSKIGQDKKSYISTSTFTCFLTIIFKV